MDGTLAKPGPVGNGLQACSIAIVPESVKRDSNLMFYRKLRVIGIIEKDGVVLEGRHELIEGEWTDSKVLPEVIWAAGLQCREDVVEIGWTTGKGIARLLVAMRIHVVNLLPNPPPKERRALIV